jgi:hypothetical protein
MEPVAALLVLLILLVAGYSILRSRRGGCKTDTDCIPPSTCQNGKCARAPEVYHYDTGRYELTFEDAEAAAVKLNAKIATIEQVQAAKDAGGSWCNFGWVADKNIAYPMNKEASGCATGINYRPPYQQKFGVNLYGVKPPRGRYHICDGGTYGCLLPFSDLKWSQHDPAPPEVYYYDEGYYTLNFEEAEKAAVKLNAKIATIEQVQAAKDAGGSWCNFGWIADKNIAYPMNKASPGCKIGTNQFLPLKNQDTYGVNLYGVKPPRGRYPICEGGTHTGGCLLPFSNLKWSYTDMWSQYDP